jgi:hypothetical protein
VDEGVGVALRKGTTLTLLLWIADIGLRVGMPRGGVALSVTTGGLPLFLGVTLAARNVVIWLRGREVPLPTSTPAGSRR